jgi:hypothetical protein
MLEDVTLLVREHFTNLTYLFATDATRHAVFVLLSLFLQAKIMIHLSSSNPNDESVQKSPSNHFLVV